MDMFLELYQPSQRVVEMQTRLKRYAHDMKLGLKKLRVALLPSVAERRGREQERTRTTAQLAMIVGTGVLCTRGIRDLKLKRDLKGAWLGSCQDYYIEYRVVTVRSYIVPSNAICFGSFFGSFFFSFGSFLSQVYTEFNSLPKVLCSIESNKRSDENVPHQTYLHQGPQRSQ